MIQFLGGNLSYYLQSLFPGRHVNVVTRRYDEQKFLKDVDRVTSGDAFVFDDEDIAFWAVDYVSALTGEVSENRVQFYGVMSREGDLKRKWQLVLDERVAADDRGLIGLERDDIERFLALKQD